MTDALAVCLSPLLRMVSISTDYACIDDDERHELTTKSMMTLVASRRRGIIPGHGLVADQTVPASARKRCLVGSILLSPRTPASRIGGGNEETGGRDS